MPFAETSAMDLRVQFVAACLAGEETMTELCALYGISRKTGYKWLSRYRSEGPSGLEERSRAPLHPGWSIEDEIAARLTEVRRAHPFWGPRKVLGYLRARDPSIAWPAASTVGDLFRREGLSEPRRRRRSRAPVGESPLTPSDEPNRVWCADFKGWFRTQDNTRCDPLTVTDNHSRYLLACEIVAPTGAGVRPVLDRLFREHGLPEVFRTDNGTPFAAPMGVAGLGRLSVELIKLGIKVEWIEPGCPQQNGRHERMHRTLKAETARPPAATVADQQVRFDRFRASFNDERPHEALGQVPPATLWRPSPRVYPDHLLEPWYDPDHAVRRVRSDGSIKWAGAFVFVSEALVGELVGIMETESGDWIVKFFDIKLGVIDQANRKLRRFAPPRPGRRKAEQTQNTVTHVAGQ